MTRLLSAAAGSDAPSITDAGGSNGSATSGGAQIDSFSDAVDQATTEVQDLAAGIVEAIPRLVIGLVVLVLFWALARLAKRLLVPRIRSVQSESVARMVGGMISGTIIGIGGFVFLSILFPSVNASTLLGGAGVLALAAGFAFQDILENLMAGVMLIVRQPFAEDDVVEVDGAVGVIEAITLRETTIRRFDRQQMVVPNSQVLKNAIRIQTHRDAIRSSVIVGVGYDEDLQRAEDVAVEALRGTDGVLADPAPEAFYVELGGSSINLDLRFFHAPGQHELRRVQGEVVKAVKRAFDEHGIGIPFPIVTLDAMDGVARAVDAIADGGGSTRSGDPSLPYARERSDP